MHGNPLVTIICLCYNHQEYVLECLESVLSQNYPSTELIIVDDCSTDNSKSVIEQWLLKHPEITFISNPKNLGVTKSFNKAAKIAKGEYLIDLAADDVLYPNCAALLIDAFGKSQYQNLGLVYGNCELISESGKFQSYYFDVDIHKKVIKKRLTGDIYTSVLSGGDSICSVSSMFKKEVFESLGGYDENLAYEDLDFWIRCSREYNIDFTDEILIKKRTDSNSLTGAFYRKNSRINYSTYLILKKALKLNRTKKEDLALQKSVHQSIVHSYRIKDYGLLLKNIWLRIIISFRKNFRKY